MIVVCSLLAVFTLIYSPVKCSKTFFILFTLFTFVPTDYTIVWACYIAVNKRDLTESAPDEKK